MIRTVQQSENHIIMFIKLNFDFIEICDFLHKKGYEVKSYLQVFPEEKGFLVDEPRMEKWTFTATKNGEPQSNENHYLKVFEKEIKGVLKEVRD